MRVFIAVLLTIFCLKAEDIINFSTLEAEFIQTVTNEQNSSIIYNGKVWLKKPDLAVWRYTKPIQKEIFINDKSIVIVEPELFQATMLKSEQSINILKVWQSSKPISKTQRVSTINNSKVTITHDSNHIKTIFYKDELENFVTIEFNNQQKNPQLANDFFKAKVPEDFDIIVQ